MIKWGNLPELDRRSYSQQMEKSSKENPQIQVSPYPERLLNALASLNEIGLMLNNLGPSRTVTVESTLRLIAESAIKVIPESSAVIYTYSASRQLFKRESRVSAGEIRFHPSLARHSIRLRQRRIFSGRVGGHNGKMFC